MGPRTSPDLRTLVSQNLQITAAQPESALLDLPWHIPLEEWPESILAALPRGISRHIVRFVKLGGRVIAVKEIGETVAYNEYELLRALNRLGVPSVTPLAVVNGRRDENGERLEAVLVTQHLQYSMPYRVLFSRVLRGDTVQRLIDALAVLLVRLHVVGLYWGDVSPSNTPFRRDAETFAAYLADAETGELHPRLTAGQRAYDLEVARVSVVAGLVDLVAGGRSDTAVDTVAVGARLVERYTELWDARPAEECFGAGGRWRVARRGRGLNELGFDVGEL